MANRILGLERAQWWFLLKWVLASAAGWTVGRVAGEFSSFYVGALVYLNVGGLIFGTAQWLILPKQICRPGRWVLVTAMGWVVGSAVGWLVFRAVGWVVVGAAVGTAQWLILRRRVCRFGWWVLVSAVGWLMGSLLCLNVDSLAGKFVPALVVGTVYGVITGPVLILLLRHPVKESSEAEA